MKIPEKEKKSDYKTTSKLDKGQITRQRSSKKVDDLESLILQGSFGSFQQLPPFAKRGLFLNRI